MVLGIRTVAALVLDAQQEQQFKVGMRQPADRIVTVSSKDLTARGNGDAQCLDRCLKILVGLAQNPAPGQQSGQCIVAIGQSENGAGIVGVLLKTLFAPFPGILHVDQGPPHGGQAWIVLGQG